MICGKCGYPLMRSWGGYGHAPGYTGKRHVVTAIEAPRSSDRPPSPDLPVDRNNHEQEARP